MPYVYELTFDIPSEGIAEIDRVGASLDRVVAYLRAIVPDFEGYMGSRAMFSIDKPDAVTVRFETVWEGWRDAEGHIRSAYQPAKVFEHFGYVDPQTMNIRIYQEVGAG